MLFSTRRCVYLCADIRYSIRAVFQFLMLHWIWGYSINLILHFTLSSMYWGIVPRLWAAKINLLICWILNTMIKSLMTSLWIHQLYQETKYWKGKVVCFSSGFWFQNCYSIWNFQLWDIVMLQCVCRILIFYQTSLDDTIMYSFRLHFF